MSGILRIRFNLICLFSIIGLVSCNNKHSERMVAFDDYQIHIKETGQGQPTVIIEAGLGSGFETYDTLHTAISTLTKVVSYDRPGLGESINCPHPRVLQVYTSELKGLLETEKIMPPYILVGHSLGGLIIRYYAYLYPEEIVGLVFIDYPPEDWIEYIRSTHSNEEIEKFNRLIDPNLNQSTGVVQREWERFEYNCELMKGIAIPKHIPIRIITAIQYGSDQQALGYHPEDMQVWAEMQARIMNNSRKSKQIITDKSGHSIHLTEPELIINSVKELVEIFRKDNINH